MTHINKISIENHPVWKKFEWATVPQVAVITGINGAGKTKLLEAMYMLLSKQQLTISVDRHAIHFQAHIEGAISSSEFSYVPWNRGGNSFESISPANLYDEKRGFVNAIRSRGGFSPNDGQNYLFAQLTEKFLGKSIDAKSLESQEFDAAFLEAWIYSRDLTNNQHISRIFKSYKIKYEQRRNKSWDGNLGKSDTHDQIITDIGQEPWVIINDLFEMYGFKYRINFPQESHDYYEVKFISQESDRVDFTQLSSGEQMIVTLILWAFDPKAASLKKLLLLDEPDAHLHPEMSRMFKDIIYDVLVKKFGLQILLTTHSPTTVAVFPEDAIYVLEPRKGIKNANKQYAISILTQGIPTLSIDYEGRRQIFTEDNKDAERYDSIYQIIKKEIQSERSLTFIGIAKNGEATTGCSAVKKIVKDLRDAGNNTVFGLLDWDKKNTPEDGIFILGLSKRYTVENFLFDPLLLAVLIFKENSMEARKTLSLSENEGIFSFRDFDAVRLQAISRKIQDKVLEQDTTAHSQVEEKYIGNFSIAITESYLHMPGHLLENKIKDAFPFLNRFSQNGKMAAHVINEIMLDFKNFIPIGLVQAYQDLLDA